MRKHLHEPAPLAANAALFLDLDGTLLEFADSPDAVSVPDSFQGLLQGLKRRLHGAIAIVSGRSIAMIDDLTGGAVAAVAGLHGAERRDSHGIHVQQATRPFGLDSAKTALLAFVDRNKNTLLEDKGAILALHYRLNPDAADSCFQEMIQLAASLPDLAVCQGNAVVELRPRSVSKDKAIAAFMSEHPFVGRTAVFVGDDVTDEDGFRYVRAANGVAVLAGPQRTTHATARLATVADVHTWLQAAIDNGGHPND